jgi:hypothetical protein
MTTIANIAQRILDENNFPPADSSDTTETNIATTLQSQNNWTTGDLTLTETETLIDLAIYHVNLMADTDIAALTGVADSKSLVGTKGENFAVMMVAALLVRAHLDKGPNVSVGSLGINAVTTDPQYAQFMDYINKAIEKLRRQISLTDMEYLIDNAVDLINLYTGSSIADLSGAAESKSLTATDNQIAVIKLVASEYLKGYSKDGLAGFSLSAAVKDAVGVLRGRSFVTT